MTICYLFSQKISGCLTDTVVILVTLYMLYLSEETKKNGLAIDIYSPRTAQVDRILPHVAQGPTYFPLEVVNILAVHDLVTQGTRPSATTILTVLKRNNKVPSR